jgi:hypothetical protein
LANVATTLFGMPGTWLALLGIEFETTGGAAYELDSFPDLVLAVTLQAPWLVPHWEDPHWAVTAAGLFLLVPFFFVTWLLEYFIVRWLLSEAAHGSIWIAVRNANLLSYALLAISLILLGFFQS